MKKVKKHLLQKKIQQELTLSIPINHRKNILSNHYTFNQRYLNPTITFDYSFNKILENEKKKLEAIDGRTKKFNFMKNKAFINEFAKKRKNSGIFESNKSSTLYLSLVKNNFNKSDKMRFYEMMEKLNQLKALIKFNQKEQFDIIKKFLINCGIVEQELSDSKLKIFLNFLQKDNFLIDPSKTLIDNIIDILNNKIYDKGIFFQKKNNSIEPKNRKLEHIFKNKTNKMKYNTIEKFKVDRFDLDLINNMNKQNEINRRLINSKNLDIIKEPENIIEELESKLKKEKNNNNLFNKTYDVWSRNLKYNIYINQNLDLNCIRDYNVGKIEKKNLLTEYACLLEAKNNYDLKFIKTEFNI